MQIISAAIAQALPDGLATEIVYLPEGTHTLTPWVDGKPKEITVKVAAENGTNIAATFQRDFEARKKLNVRPWFDFEHKGGVASALPQGFRYEPGKGIMAAVEWTGAGKSAIEGKDFSYFSPTFRLGNDGVPAGLPSRGPLGALVNEPAFREIPRIAAEDATNSNHTLTDSMKLICAALAIAAESANAEDAAVTAINRLKTDKATVEANLATANNENTALKSEVTTLKAEVEAGRKDRAKALVEAAIADGRLKPKDDATNNAFIDAITAELGTKSEMHQTILASMPKTNEGLEKPIVEAGQAGRKGAAVGFEARAEALVKAGEAKDLSDALEMVAASDPKAYGDYLTSVAPK